MRKYRGHCRNNDKDDDALYAMVDCSTEPCSLKEGSTTIIHCFVCGTMSSNGRCDLRF